MAFLQELAAHCERPALIFPGRPAISYAELARRAAETAAGFGRGRKLVAVALLALSRRSARVAVAR